MSSIVMIDDEPWALRDMRDIIKWSDFGFDDIHTFDDSSAAFNFIIATNPDIIMTDIRMPEMSGLDLIDRCISRGISSLCVVVSAYADFNYARKALESKVFSYILKPLKKEEMTKLAKKMAEELKSRAPESSVKIPSSYYRSTGKVISYVSTHFMEVLSLQELADKFNISLSHLSRSFKKTTGLSFTDYVANKRIDYACKLLAETDISIAQIGQIVGYQDYFHFSKIFHKHTGKSPTQVRKEAHSENKQ